MSSQFTILNTGDATTCGATDITWFYEGEGALALLVTNIGVPQENPIPTTTHHFTTADVKARATPTGVNEGPAPTAVLIGSNIDSADFKFVWDPVAVESGWYIIKASITEQALNVDSSPFFVKGSTDTSCLSSVPSSPAPSSTPPPPTSNTLPTTSVDTVILTSTPNASGTSVPVAGAGSSSLSKGAIIGIALGAIALVLGWLLAWWFFFRKGKRSARAQGRGGVKKLGHRSALASMDSTSGLMGKPSRNPFASRQPSTGTIALSPSDDGGLEKGSMNSAYRSAFPDTDAPHTADHAQTPLAHGGRKYSASSAMTLDLPALDYSQTSRRPSHTETGYGRQSMESGTYPPAMAQAAGQTAGAYALTRSHSLSTSATHQMTTVSQGGGPQSTTSHSGLLYQASAPSSAAPSPSPYSRPGSSSPDSSSSPSDASNPTKPSRRQSVSGKKRKPVPVYDPDAEELSTSPSALSPPSVPPSTSSTPIPPPSPVPPVSAPSHSPHYTTRNRSQPELTHKSSFGPGGLEGKPMHYLIPDMPPPSKG